MNKNILLAGLPKTGKTTLIKEIIEKMDRNKLCGFYTDQVMEGGKRVGFVIKGLSGKEGILAHIDIKSNKRVGKYGVKIEDLEGIGVKEIERGNKAIIIDEIGKMELFSTKFKQAVISALNSNNMVLGTIGMIEDKFVKKIKGRTDTTIIVLSRDNYQRIKEAIVDLVHSYL